MERLQGGLRGRLPAVAQAVAAVAAVLLLRLGHDARLPLDPTALGDALLRRMAPLQVRNSPRPHTAPYDPIQPRIMALYGSTSLCPCTAPYHGPIWLHITVSPYGPISCPHVALYYCGPIWPHIMAPYRGPIWPHTAPYQGPIGLHITVSPYGPI